MTVDRPASPSQQTRKKWANVGIQTFKLLCWADAFHMPDMTYPRLKTLIKHMLTIVSICFINVFNVIVECANKI